MTVTKEQWLIDIKNTKKECQAYKQIAEGFEVLEKLPENIENGKSLEYKVRAFHYLSLWNKCEDFLVKLYSYEGDLE